MKTILFILTISILVYSANDSTSIYTDTVHINWKRSVIGIHRDTATNIVKLSIPGEYIKYLPGDTTQPFITTCQWTKFKMQRDSALGLSMWNLLDTIFVHGGKYLKTQAK